MHAHHRANRLGMPLAAVLFLCTWSAAHAQSGYDCNDYPGTYNGVSGNFHETDTGSEWIQTFVNNQGQVLYSFAMDYGTGMTVDVEYAADLAHHYGPDVRHTRYDEPTPGTAHYVEGSSSDSDKTWANDQGIASENVRNSPWDGSSGHCNP